MPFLQILSDTRIKYLVPNKATGTKTYLAQATAVTSKKHLYPGERTYINIYTLEDFPIDFIVAMVRHFKYMPVDSDEAILGHIRKVMAGTPPKIPFGAFYGTIDNYTYLFGTDGSFERLRSVSHITGSLEVLRDAANATTAN